MSIIYFDICSIPLFLMILFLCHSRRMTKGKANQLFIVMVLLSLFSAIADLGMEVSSNMAPLSGTGLILCNVFSYVYLLLRNATNAVLLLFLLALTRTTFLLRKSWAKIAFALPYLCVVFLLAQNPITHNAFTVTAEAGYNRAPLIMVLYGSALIYGIGGLCYCIYCRRYLPMDKWGVLMCIYVLVHLAVLVQFFYPELLLEMFCSAMGETMIMLAIMRPEERMDSAVGMLSWASYQSDLQNIILSGEHVQIIVIRMQNYRVIHNYLGDHNYNAYLAEIADGIRGIRWNRQHNLEIYHERPDTIYMVLQTDGDDVENIEENLLHESGVLIRNYEKMGARFEPKICLIRCPEDLQTAEDIISLGHKFQKIDGRNKILYRASEIVNSRNFAIEARIEEILDRAIKDNNIEMYYQPIYDVRTDSFHSAEALARIIDPEYGMISPAIFIPAAERQGFIIPLGDMVLDQVFRFISENDLKALGLTQIEINISVAQCMESSLPKKLIALQQKYGIEPNRINMEITETTFENINEITVENVNELIRMGYRFALDDYGIGYSSIQRINHIPLELVKIDKSLLDEASSDKGRLILEHTVRMMQSIGKKLVAEGAETSESVDILKNMNCDYIQGFYFSRPLPAVEFIRYLEQHQATRSAATGR